MPHWLWALFLLNFFLGVWNSLTNNAQATLFSVLYTFPQFNNVPKALGLLSFPVCLWLLMFKKPETQRLNLRIFLLGVSLFFLPNTGFLLNQKLDFSIPVHREGWMESVGYVFKNYMGVVRLQEGGGSFAIALSGEDYQKLSKLGARLGVMRVEVLGVRRGFLGIKWQAQPGYRLVPNP